jgi:membrane-associated phospholipid phosphatase
MTRREHGNQRLIPLFALIVLALAAGSAGALFARRYHGPTQPAVDAATVRSARLNPQALTGLALTVALVVIFVGGIVLGALAVVVRDTHALSGIDSAIADWGDRHATRFSTDGLKLVTSLGETWMAVIVCLFVAVVDLRIKRNRWVVPFLLAVVVGDKLLTSGLKALVDRVRPDLNPVAHTLGPSFPSGHTSTAAALWAAVALTAWRWYGRRSLAPLAGAAIGIAVAVGASRVFLDVHWTTDVIAGLALGWMWFAACAVAFGGRLLRPMGASTAGSSAPGVIVNRSGRPATPAHSRSTTADEQTALPTPQ